LVRLPSLGWFAADRTLAECEIEVIASPTRDTSCSGLTQGSMSAIMKFPILEGLAIR
jgi:hypothetical protein